MPQSLAQIYLHIVFSTKDRIPFLKDPELRTRTHAFLSGICNNLGSPTLKVGGVEDHVHIACRFSRKMAVMDLLKIMKEKSSKWIKKQDPAMSSFYWQNGYGAFSVSHGHVPKLLEYIDSQEEHHREETFKPEFRRLLEKNGVEYDERYVWD